MASGTISSASFSKRGTDSAAAYKQLKEDLVKVEKYLVAKGVDGKNILVYQVGTISMESSELIDQGVEFSSGAPEYYYTKLDELKIEMLTHNS